MNAITKAISSTSYNRNNLLLTGAVLIFVVALFFIPEILDFQRSIGGGDPHPVKENSDYTVAPAGEAPVENVITPLGEISRMLSESDARMLGSQPHEEAAPDAQAVPRDVIEQREAVANILARRPLGWEAIENEATQRLLGRARQDASDFLKSLPEKESGVRYAVYNYLNGLEMVGQANSKSLSAEEAVNYLAALDRQVTQSIAAAGLDRAVFVDWTKINIGPVLEGAKAVRAESVAHVAFRPRVGLLRAKVWHHPPQIDPETPGQDVHVYVSFDTFVKGDEVKKVQIYEGGVHITDLAPADPPLNLEKLGIKIVAVGPYLNARKLITLRFLDKNGESYEKSYQFYPRVHRFGRNNGEFVLPFRNGLVDPTLDRFFRAGGGGGSEGTVASSGAFGNLFDGSFDGPTDASGYERF